MKMSLYCTGLLLASLVQAVPFMPSDDKLVLETLPTKTMPGAERQALHRARAAWKAEPHNMSAVDNFARLYIERTRQTSDPRYLGYALALLAPWTHRADVPPPIRLLRAAIAQRNHQFELALTELDLLLKQDPANTEAWLMRAAIQQVRADYVGARASCAKLNSLSELMLGLVCTAQIDGLTGRAAQAYRRLDQLAKVPQTGLTRHLSYWLGLSRIDLAMRLGREREADEHFRALLTLDEPTPEFKTVYSDWLLAKQRFAEVIELTRNDGRDDGLLLRRALARAAMGQAAADGDIALLRDRYRAAHLRGDLTHLREEARFNLTLLRKPTAALSLAQANWRMQKEPADAKILLAAAAAARRPDTAQPVREWMRASGIQDVTLEPMLTELGRMQAEAGS